MNPLELVLLLLVVAAGLAVVAARFAVPYPVLLVLGGLGLAFVPHLPRVELDPQLVLIIFLLPLLFAAAWITSWRDFSANLRPIASLAIGLVIVTMTAVAWVAHAVIPGMAWPIAFVLGAIVSPPDAVAATAVFQRLKVPRRIVTIIEGESLVNDATGLVAYKFAVAAAMIGTFSLPAASGRFVVVVLGGVAVGLAVGWVVAQLHRRLDNFEVETIITLLSPYAAYIPAEHAGVSGVLATVTAGGYLGWRNPELLSALTRFRGIGVWNVLLLLFQGLVFILIGMELETIRDIAFNMSWKTLIGHAALVSLVAIVARLAYVPVGIYIPRLLSRTVRRREPRPAWPNVLLLGWTGMRGIVSLALALALPLVLPSGKPFPMRETVIILAFGVIVATLLVQGLSLPWLIRVLRVKDDGADLREEREALIRATQTALARLDEIESTVVIHPQLMERVRAPYEERLARLTAETVEDPECKLTEGEATAYRRLRGQSLDAERRAVVVLRNEGKISEEVLHRVQEALDLEALQPDR